MIDGCCLPGPHEGVFRVLFYFLEHICIHGGKGFDGNGMPRPSHGCRTEWIKVNGMK
jgi:hypothetical protein